MEEMQQQAREPAPVKQEEKRNPGLVARALIYLWVDNKERAPREVMSTLAAFVREGLKDLRDFFLNPWQEQPLAHTEEPGMPAVLTQIEVTRERHPEMYERGEAREYPPPQAMVVRGKEVERG